MEYIFGWGFLGFMDLKVLGVYVFQSYVRSVVFVLCLPVDGFAVLVWCVIVCV